MRLGLLSDVHGNVEAWRAVRDVLRAAGVTHLLCAGDVVNYGPDPETVLQEMLEEGVSLVRGNHDAVAAAPDPWSAWRVPPGRDEQAERWALSMTLDRLSSQALRLLRELPLMQTLPSLGPGVTLFHGAASDPWRYLRPGDPDTVYRELLGSLPGALWVGGHTHLPHVRRLGDAWYVNPGSTGWPKDGDPRASCAVVTWEQGQPEPRVVHHRVPYPLEVTRRKLRALGAPDALLDAWAGAREMTVR